MASFRHALVTHGRRRKPCACAARAVAETLEIMSRHMDLTHTAAVYHESDAGSHSDMPADGCRLTSSRPCGQVVAEGAGLGGTSAGRGGVRGTHGGHPGPLGAVAKPLAAERHLTWCRASRIYD